MLNQLRCSMFAFVCLATGSTLATGFVTTDEGCKIKLQPGESPLRVSWSGTCKGGLAEGVGILTWKETQADPATSHWVELIKGETRYPDYSIEANPTQLSIVEALGQSGPYRSLAIKECTSNMACTRVITEYSKWLGRGGQKRTDFDSPPPVKSTALNTSSSAKIEKIINKTPETNCPTKIADWSVNTRDEVEPWPPYEIHTLPVFQARAGDTMLQGDPQVPKLSVPQPVTESDLKKLTRNDWLSLRSFYKQLESIDMARLKREHDIRHEELKPATQKAASLRAAALQHTLSCYASMGSSTSVSKSAASANKADDKGSVGLFSGESARSKSGLISQDKEIEAASISKSSKSRNTEAEAYANNASKEPGRIIGAKIIKSSCVTFKNKGTGVSYEVKQVTNNCSIPVAVTFCFFDPAKTDQCFNGKGVGWGTSSVIKAKGTSLTVSPIMSTRKWRVHYYVCDMTDDSKLCLRPK